MHQYYKRWSVNVLSPITQLQIEQIPKTTLIKYDYILRVRPTTQTIHQ